jgi:hypothetical protein
MYPQLRCVTANRTYIQQNTQSNHNLTSITRIVCLILGIFQLLLQFTTSSIKHEKDHYKFRMQSTYLIMKHIMNINVTILFLKSANSQS